MIEKEDDNHGTITQSCEKLSHLLCISEAAVLYDGDLLGEHLSKGYILTALTEVNVFKPLAWLACPSPTYLAKEEKEKVT